MRFACKRAHGGGRIARAADRRVRTAPARQKTNLQARHQGRLAADADRGAAGAVLRLLALLGFWVGGMAGMA